MLSSIPAGYHIFTRPLGRTRPYFRYEGCIIGKQGAGKVRKPLPHTTGCERLPTRFRKEGDSSLPCVMVRKEPGEDSEAEAAQEAVKSAPPWVL